MQPYIILIGAIVTFLTAVKMISTAYEKTNVRPEKMLKECEYKFDSKKLKIAAVDSKVEEVGKTVYKLKNDVMVNRLEIQETKTEWRHVCEEIRELKESIQTLNKDVRDTMISKK